MNLFIYFSCFFSLYNARLRFLIVQNVSKNGVGVVPWREDNHESDNKFEGGSDQNNDQIGKPVGKGFPDCIDASQSKVAVDVAGDVGVVWSDDGDKRFTGWVDTAIDGEGAVKQFVKVGKGQCQNEKDDIDQETEKGVAHPSVGDWCPSLGCRPRKICKSMPTRKAASMPHRLPTRNKTR